MDIGPVSMEKLKAGLLSSVWPRCRCTHGCDCSQATIAPADAGDADLHNLDLTSKPCDCVQMHLFAVPDDCSGGIAKYTAALHPIPPIAVKPGVIGVEGGTCSVPMVLQKLSAFDAFHIPRKSRVVTFPSGGSPPVDGVKAVRTAAHSRVLLLPNAKEVEEKKHPQVFLSTQDAVTQAQGLSLPLAKLRLTQEPSPASFATIAALNSGSPATKGTRHTLMQMHCPDIKCQSCSSKIYKKMKERFGLEPGLDTYVSVEKKEVAVLLSKSAVTGGAEDLTEANMEAFKNKIISFLSDISLPVESRKMKGRVATVHIEGISCKSCVAAIKKNLKPIELDLDFEKRVLNDVPSNLVEHVISVINSLQGGKYKATLRDMRAVEQLSSTPDFIEVFVSSWESRLERAVAPGWGARIADNESLQTTQAAPPASHVINVQATENFTHHDPGLRRNNSREKTQSSFIVRGMTCASCVSRIEDHLLQIPGILSANVALATETAKVSHLVSFSPDVIAKELTDLGYASSVITEASEDDLKRQLSRDEEQETLKRAATFSLLLALPAIVMMVVGPYSMTVMNWMAAPVFAPSWGLDHVDVGLVLQLLTSTVSVFVYGRGFFTRARQAVSHGAYTMDVLVALGVGTAYASGWIFLFTRVGTPSADAASVLVGFMLLGKYFEAIAKMRTADELRSLLELRPTHALIVEKLPSGGFTDPYEIVADKIVKGDIVKVVTGSKVPVDGVILEGSMEVDQSMLTGEQLPVTKEVKDAVAGGTECVNGMAYVVATHVGSDSTLSQIIRLINDAQASKSPIQKYADVIAAKFVPMVLVVCAISFTSWLLLGIFHLYPTAWRGDMSPLSFAMNFLMATLVVACPCAMGLATPTAVMVSTGVGAKMGIFIKGGEAVEASASIDAVLFDKTGTITTGKVSVKAAEYFGKGTRTEALAWIAEVESSSQHPVAKAVITFCRDTIAKESRSTPAVTSSNHVTIPGSGVECDIDGKRVVAGEAKWVLNRCFPSKDDPKRANVQRVVDAWHSEGTTVVLSAVNSDILWGFSIKDIVKPEAKAAVRHLQITGHRVLLVTGDNRKAALKVADHVGIEHDDVFAEVLPGDKAEVVKRVQRETGNVMFVGDGINDAPALAQAQVGIALGSGTAVAIESADAVLLNDNLQGIPIILKLARMTLRRIKMNFVWAFGYNLLALPIAAGLTFPLVQEQLPPVVGGMAMVGSSLLVLTSSLLLRTFTAPDIYAETGIRREETKAPFGSKQKSYGTNL